MASGGGDFFRPWSEPARSIYDAFQAEAANREGRPFEVWHRAEIDAVWMASLVQAARHQLRALDRDEVVEAESYASGSADYGSKWAFAVVDRMRRPPRD